MKEHEWLNAADPFPMLDFLGRRASVRQLRLLVCACCRRWWQHLSAEARRSVEAGEAFVEGKINVEEMKAAQGPCYGGVRADNSAYYAATPSQGFRRRFRGALYNGAWSAGWPEWVTDIIPETEAAEKAAQAALIRDIVGNPFRSIKVKPAWRTSTVVALAAQIYESREFSAMPILADALQDAGCDNNDVLNHCREEATHVRGCWVVDLVLGKE